MLGKNFHSVTNRNGILGIRCNNKSATTMMCYKSPYASAQSNNWLEHKLIRLYTTYYYKVIWESTGRFWKENEPAITATYASFYGGDTLYGDKDEKPKTW